MEETDGLPMKTVQLEPSQRQQDDDRKMKAAILSKLALHFWRPDFTSAQAGMLIGDYLEDLKWYAPTAVEHACKVYRRKPDSRFFPTSGQLLGILGEGNDTGEERSRLPTFRAPRMIDAPRSALSVAEVLEKHGFNGAAAIWRKP